MTTWLLAGCGAVIVYQIAVIAVMRVAWTRTRVEPRRTPAALGLEYADVWIPTANGRRLHGWWIPGGEGRRRVVVLVHGWGRNTERMLPYATILHPAGVHLLAFDARHHGLSDADGHASMKKFSEDIRAVVDFVAARPDADLRELAVVGLSIGGAAAIHAAAHEPRIRAVATVGAFAHPGDAMRRLGVASWLLAPAMPLTLRYIEWRVGVRLDDLAPERHAGRIDGRLLLIHGEQDETVPVENVERLARAAGAGAEVWRIAGRGHSDPHLEPGFAERLLRFLDLPVPAVAARRPGTGSSPRTGR
ncbi:MAG: alpha/beta fold hydrolase [Acidobacteria bacterium]|nr:MAG: alpha/beta fold hydrolase [Acidobacteriota bacterium]